MGMVFVRYKEYNATKNCLKDQNGIQELQLRMAVNTFTRRKEATE
jgi:hypothetical protein